MEQEGVGERNRRIVQQGGDRQPPPARPCPRCDSPNTKFCYYNNYSLAQPRYLCKTCKRYWTQGGTLRNVPIGGGSRKGKRAKNASSSSGLQQPPPPQPEAVVVQNQQPNFTTVMTTQEPSPFYEGGGGGAYLSSLAAAIHSQPNPFDDNSLNLNNVVGSSNLGFVSGLNVAASLGQIQPPPYQFSQGFINNSTTTTSEASALWSTTISTTSSISGSSSTQRNNASASGSSPFIPPNQWP